MSTKNYKYKINGTVYNVAIGDIENNIAKVQVNGVPYNVELDNESKPVTIKAAPAPAAAPRTPEGNKVISKPSAASAGAGTAVKAPLPGTVLSINCQVGDTVTANDTIATLEAMKMENDIKAGRDGKVTAILVNVGDSVQEGADIVTIA